MQGCYFWRVLTWLTSLTSRISTARLLPHLPSENLPLKSDKGRSVIGKTKRGQKGNRFCTVRNLEPTNQPTIPHMTLGPTQCWFK